MEQHRNRLFQQVSHSYRITHKRPTDSLPKLHEFSSKARSFYYFTFLFYIFLQKNSNLQKLPVLLTGEEGGEKKNPTNPPQTTHTDFSYILSKMVSHHGFALVLFFFPHKATTLAVSSERTKLQPVLLSNCKKKTYVKAKYKQDYLRTSNKKWDRTAYFHNSTFLETNFRLPYVCKSSFIHSDLKGTPFYCNTKERLN